MHLLATRYRLPERKRILAGEHPMNQKDREHWKSRVLDEAYRAKVKKPGEAVRTKDPYDISRIRRFHGLERVECVRFVGKQSKDSAGGVA